MQYPNDVASFYPRKALLFPKSMNTEKRGKNAEHQFTDYQSVLIIGTDPTFPSLLKVKRSPRQRDRGEEQRRCVDSDGDALSSDVRFRSAAPRVSNRRSISGIFDPRRKGLSTSRLEN